ncbi:DUF7108 domain-containing protein [Halanaeroarchaeum sulfurireducens]|uniref:RnhA operon protein n=1 Tax=Halanaeroarchaeum sulfurireducens TaxID=1604004 RepID=A0A0N9N409_9EURY|nr:hypothetical protein [Halanaeroarchaeum sulfurireducens]ALG81483.1 hypothetical protein HLASA_0582 [Halanaeroarchaeum sulfurireducens]
MADDPDTDAPEKLPASTVDEAVRLTRLARNAVDENEAAAHRERRAARLEEYGFTARVREEENGETLVCHPAEWLEDGVVDFTAVENTDRATEVPLSGRGEQGTWEDAEAENRTIVEAVREQDGAIHAKNARAFADFMGNHYAAPIADARATHIQEALREYYPRNAWPTDEQWAVVVESLRRTFEKTEPRQSVDSETG